MRVCEVNKSVMLPSDYMARKRSKTACAKIVKSKLTSDKLEIWLYSAVYEHVVAGYFLKYIDSVNNEIDATEPKRLTSTFD